MKTPFFLAVIILISFQMTALSQKCLPEGIIFTTQAGIDNFHSNYPDCTEIEGDVGISGQDISNLSGLDVLTSIGGHLLIWENELLHNLMGLHNITTIGGSLLLGCFDFETWDTFYGNPALKDLTGLNSLTYIGGNLQIVNNDSLINLTGLSSLTRVEKDLFIGVWGDDEQLGNPRLINLAGLDNLNSIGGSLDIQFNENLESLENLNHLTSIGGSVRISGTNKLVNLTGFNNLSIIPGDLEIGGQYSNNSCLNSLTGLENLVSIGGSCLISYNDVLTDFTGLNNLDKINGDLTIGDSWGGNPSLTSLTGLGNLTLVKGKLSVLDNDALSSLGGINNLYRVEGGLELWNNDDITSLTGLNDLHFVGGTLRIYNNDALTSLSGLENLDSIGGSLTIGVIWGGSNPSLLSLEALGSLKAIGGDLTIAYNDVLSDLEGLHNIGAATIENICIVHNTSLYNCDVQSICMYLTAPNGTIEIHDNYWGCDSQEEVEEGCGIVALEKFSGNTELSVYPNPASSQIIVDFTFDRPTVICIEVLNSMGQVIATVQHQSHHSGEQQVTCDMEQLPAGVYYYRLTANSEQRMVTGKMVVIR